MRKIYSFFPFLILSVWAFSQTDCRVVIKGGFPHNTSKVSGVTISTTDTSKKALRLRCGAPSIASGNEPLIIADGILIENKSIASLNPDDIESIEILKGAAALALYGCRAYPGVIIITTKSKSGFVVKDFLTGTSIPSATVTFTSVKNIKDTLAFIADDNGIITTDKLKAGEEYSVKVTSVGYKGYYTNYKRQNKQQEFLLERDVVLNSEVVVTNTYCPRQISCGFVVTKITSCLLLIDSASSVMRKSNIYPNPLRRGSEATIEIHNAPYYKMQLKIFSADRRQLLAESLQLTKGDNRFTVSTDSRWMPGIYFLQLITPTGQLFKTEKLVIQ